ncbi:MAG: hypothetical protein N2D54_09705 [Chloroflexota bacterium]
MKNTKKYFGWFLIITGIVLILQGINILPGSFMTGQIKWAYAGIVSLILGAGLLRYRKSAD